MQDILYTEAIQFPSHKKIKRTQKNKNINEYKCVNRIKQLKRNTSKNSHWVFDSQRRNISNH